MNAIAQYALIALIFASALFVLALAVYKIKTLFTVATLTIQREIEGSGENAVINVNLYAFESEEYRFKKYQKYVRPIEMRKEFTFQRFEEIRQAAINENKAKAETLEFKKKG